MSDHFDERETRDPAAREAELFERLRAQLRHAIDGSPHYTASLAEIDPDAIGDRTALADLPVLYKSDLIEMQEARPPFGGLTPRGSGGFRRLFLSPGPIVEPEAASEHWRMARALFAAGFRRNDIVANCFAYHLTPAGFMFDHAAAEVGCAVFPGGVGNTDAQVEAFARLGVVGYVGTPDFLKIILEKAEEAGVALGSVTKALVSGGPLFPNLREWYGARGIAVRQCYGTAELGLIAYEGAGPGDGLVIDEDALVEIVRPGTGDPVPDGEVGEVVVTTFNAAYPLIRFSTGDLSAVLAGQSPCGRTNRRLKGWMGRADQTTKVRGMFVHPRQVANIVRRFPQITRARLEVGEDGGRDTLLLRIESAERGEAFADNVAEAIRAECRVRGSVAFAEPDALPNDGKVIDDKRTLGV
ncbi:AMP-binding protein [Aurantimonas sp. A2-1-M11]|uniref:phenylacetate--CoA ligase family protein n=1 Tax=Aurantimonas sp. A2-1-M11 TaxID=3113712 RepID=UPI002F931ABA